MKKQEKKLLNLFATTPKGLELLLADELRALGASTAAEKLAGVAFTGDLSLAYQACLWSRLANRILLPLATVPASTPDELYAGVQTIAWDEHLEPEGTLAVHFVCSQSNITHSLFATQKVKDAIVDQFRDKYGLRPNIAREEPQIKVYVYLHRNQASISLDFSGESLHRRNYREAAGPAPLKENLAAAILVRAGWPEIAKEGGTLLDPMCGSATLLIEGAMMAGDVAPGLLRDYFGFLGWKQHEAKLWEKLVKQAQARSTAGLAKLPTIVGYDLDPAAIKNAFENIESAGLLSSIHVEKRDLSVFAPKPKEKIGLVVVNPPYGERLGEHPSLQSIYTLLGDRLKASFLGWRVGILMGNPDLGKKMGLRAKRHYSLFNGALPCRLLIFDVIPEYFIDRSPSADNERRIRAAKRAIAGQDQQAVQMFINRVGKNLKHLRRRVEREGVSSYRIYDADLPEYSFAIDLSADTVQVQEYQAPKTVDAKKVLMRRQEVLAVLPDALNLSPAKIFFTIIARPKKERPNRDRQQARR